MKEQTIFITPATIHFYNKIFYYPNCNKWFFTIQFENAPMVVPLNRIKITLTDNKNSAEKLADSLQHHFATNHIYENSKVSIIYTTSGIIAIGANNHDIYLDLRDKFKSKKFSELNIDLASLIVNS